MRFFQGLKIDIGSTKKKAAVLLGGANHPCPDELSKSTGTR